MKFILPINLIFWIISIFVACRGVTYLREIVIFLEEEARPSKELQSLFQRKN